MMFSRKWRVRRRGGSWDLRLLRHLWAWVISLSLNDFLWNLIDTSERSVFQCRLRCSPTAINSHELPWTPRHWHNLTYINHHKSMNIPFMNFADHPPKNTWSTNGSQLLQNGCAVGHGPRNPMVMCAVHLGKPVNNVPLLVLSLHNLYYHTL